jgi:hypothetical protein
MAKKEQKIVVNIPKDDVGLPVIKAQLHQAVALHVKVPILSTLHYSKIPKLKMWLIDLGLLVMIEGELVGIIPHANIALAVPDLSTLSET